MRVLSADSQPAPFTKGFVAGLDARTKLLIMVACSLMVILLKHPLSLGILVGVTSCYVGLVGRLVPVAVVYGLVLVMMGSAMVCAGLIALWIPAMGAFSPGVFISPFLRVLVVLNTLLATALTTRVQSVLGILKALRLPYFIYLPAAVMIRFIPGFINDARQIRDSVKTKGYVLTPGAMVSQPLLTLRLLFVPLVIRALRTSDELGVAAELKGAGYGCRVTAYRTHRFGFADKVAGVATILWLLLVAVVEYGSL